MEEMENHPEKVVGFNLLLVATKTVICGLWSVALHVHFCTVVL
jgi:hypothetical protein